MRAPDIATVHRREMARFLHEVIQMLTMGGGGLVIREECTRGGMAQRLNDVHRVLLHLIVDSLYSLDA